MWVLLAGALAGLSFADVATRARPAPVELRADAILAEARREKARSRGRLLEGAALSAAAGPRRTEAGSESDAEVELDLPLALASRESRDFSAALEAAERLLPAAAALEAEAELYALYLDAWLAAAEAGLEADHLSSAVEWARLAGERLAAGADPPLEATLAQAELDGARLAAANAAGARTLAWTRLSARADLPAIPQPLLEPPAPPLGGASEATLPSDALLVMALRAESALDEARLALDAARETSRWALSGAAEREGEEEAVRLGLAYRIPLPGEGAGIRQARDARLAERRRDLDLRQSDLEARYAAGRSLAAALAPPPVSPADLEGALAALELRLREGKDRPSEAILRRRQLLDARRAALRARHTYLTAAHELHTLTRGE